MKEKLKIAALSSCVWLLSPLTAFADNVRISSIPESATMILMGATLIGLSIIRRKKFKK
ncbi:MAG: PEP-CTERM sorting domain-containing protein [Deltaproteobacteria bacterium]|nr:PEP-CTERM sorting domain-containing protein [Deltaproteobacteria bacterium]